MELHQYKKQIENFQYLTQQLISTYQQDDTSRIKRATEQVNARYAHMNNRYYKTTDCACGYCFSRFFSRFYIVIVLSPVDELCMQLKQAQYKKDQVQSIGNWMLSWLG